MKFEIKLSKEDLGKIDACVDLILLGKYRDAATLMNGSTDPLMKKLQELCVVMHATEVYLGSLSEGKIFATAWPSTHPGSRMLKQFHQNLHTLLYQMKRFAQSDYSELSKDMGDLSGCYNDMLKHLHRKQVQAELASRQDSLTGLFNRRAFLEQADKRIKDKPENNGVMLVVGLDRLCDIIDEHGQDGCDKFITGAARDFKAAVEWGDLVGRVSNNELALYTHGPKKTEEMLVELEALVLDFSGKSMDVNGVSIPCSITCGAARYPTDHNASHRLLEQALYSVRTWEYLNLRQRYSTVSSHDFSGQEERKKLDRSIEKPMPS